MIRQFIRKVVNGQDLSEQEMNKAMNEILAGRSTPAQVGAFITALRLKGETVEEVAGAARVMMSRNPRVSVDNNLVSIARDEINVEEETILDTSTKIGNGTRTFNVSTATALVAAGGGARVVKHGFGAVSTQCGSADVLRSLGVKLNLNHSNIEQCVEELGIGFFYAPLYQSPMKYVARPRTEVGVRSIFNLVGPLSNPASAKCQFLGVYTPELTEKMAQVLHRLGTKEAYVVSGEVTLDEISICGSTVISHLQNGQVRTFEIVPEQYGLDKADPEHIKGGNAKENARIIRDILNGEKGARRDLVLLNAGAVFVVCGLDNDLHSGIERAKESIDSGKAKGKLGALINFTQGCGAFVRKEISYAAA